MNEPTIRVELSLQEFSVVIEALDKYHATFHEDSVQAGTIANLINKLDREGLNAVFGEDHL